MPVPSVTKNAFVVEPNGNNPPLAMPAVCVVTALGQLSVPTGVAYVTVAAQSPGSLLAVIALGHTMLGATMSVVITTSSLDAGQGAFVIVQRSVYTLPATPVKVDVGLLGDTTEPPAPDTMVQVPTPTEGLLPAKVVVVPQIV